MPHQSAVLINFLHVTPPLGSRNVSTMPAASCSANCHQGWWFWSKGWLWLVDRSSSRSCCLSPTSVDPTVGVFIGAPGVSPRKATDVSPRLLLIITFIFSIAFLELSSHTPLEQEYFRSIPTPGVRCGGWGEGDWDFTCCIPQIWAKGLNPDCGSCGSCGCGFHGFLLGRATKKPRFKIQMIPRNSLAHDPWAWCSFGIFWVWSVLAPFDSSTIQLLGIELSRTKG